MAASWAEGKVHIFWQCKTWEQWWHLGLLHHGLHLHLCLHVLQPAQFLAFSRCYED